MRLDRFIAYTMLGASIWCAILTYIGWYLGKHATAIADFDRLVGQYAGKATVALLPLIVVVLAVYIFAYRRRKEGLAADDTAANASRTGEGK
jgi:membrane protein DedA with SNARE-associated domain